MKSFKNIYLSNISEDVWSFISTLPVKAKKDEIEENAYLSDRALFSTPPNTLFISSKPISSKFLDYVRSLIKLDPIEVYVPPHANGQLSLDVMNDRQLINKLKSYGTVNLLSYSATSEFYRLVDYLKSQNINANLPLAPLPENSDSVEEFGSKSGVRRFIPRHMAPGEIFDSLNNALNFAKEKISLGKGVVIKTNRSHAGMGVVIIPPGKIKPQVSAIKKLIGKNDYWKKFPIIVEEFISTDPSIGGGFPNLEYQINSRGVIKLLFACGMGVTPEGVFCGIEIGTGAIPSKSLLKILKFGKIISQKYAASGYRGNFDIDFCAGKNGQIYVTETNLRQTGGTHVYHLGLNLIGLDYQKNSYLASDNVYHLPPSNWTFDKISRVLKPILYDSNTKTGIVIASENMLSRNQLSYVAISPSQSQTHSLVSKLKQLINASV